MSKNFISRFFNLCTIFGIMLILGSAGASDLGRIDLNTVIIQSLIGLFSTMIGIIGSGLRSDH